MKLEPRFLKETAGLSLHAYRQILTDPSITIQDVVGKVEEYITSLVGEDVVEFKRPTHTLDDCVGYPDLKQFLKDKFIPSIQGPPDKSIAGALIVGPIGGGKTYQMEAVASMLGFPVMVLKNFRSQWFGETDMRVERIKRAIHAIIKDSGGDEGNKILIFVDEADTAFGGISKETHETERRATGKIQAMMSDSELRGRAIWLLMTARPHLLSPDIRRPGRAGELIIPIFDPADHGMQSQMEFINWVLGDIKIPPDHLPASPAGIATKTSLYSAAEFQSLKTRIKSEGCTTFKEVMDIIDDTLSSDIADTRRYQKLQAVVNCTRQSLLPAVFNGYASGDNRKHCQDEIRMLEARGIG
jgi:hypothetical protein